MSFTRALEVSPGDALNSRQQRSLARAINDRLRFAVDMPWRVAWALYNAARLVRNPDASGNLFPAEGEFWKFYSHLFDDSGYLWPLTGPGEPEGANLGSVIPQFIYGNSQLEDEPERLSVRFPLKIAGNPPANEHERWLLGAMQRGAITADGVNSYTPALEAAQTVYQFYFHPLLWHGKSYGGFQPLPPLHETNPYCDTIEPYNTWPNRRRYFTSINPGENTTGLHGAVTTLPDGRKRVTYAGSCPCSSANVGAGHILYYGDFPFAWYLAVADGTMTNGECNYQVDRLDKSKWVEGPYEGEPVPQHSDYPAILRTVWHYQSEFRGADSQRRPDTFTIESIAFDAQRFWTRQYPLAPARGVMQGANLVAVYPGITWSSDPGTSFQPFQDESGTWAPHAGFVIAGFHVHAVGLTEPVSVIIKAGDSEWNVDLTPSQPTVTLWLPDAISPASLQARVTKPLVLAPGGSLSVLAAEIQQRKPSLEDAYLLLRCTTSDTAGNQFTTAANIVSSLFTYGCVLGEYPAAQTDAITTNPLYQSFRRLSRRVRFIRREQLLSYQLSNGIAVLRFKRALGSLPLTDADPFEEIAPPPYPIADGDLVIGETYLVRGTSGTVTHNAVAYAPGETFVAVDASYQSTGDALPWVKDGIRHQALKKGWSNEWVMFLQTHCYHPSESSIWKPSIYADFFSFHAPEHFWSPSSGALKEFVNATYSFSQPSGNPPTSQLQPITVQATFINPEAPSAYTYSLGANAAASTDFMQSRQVYVRPYEIASAELEFSGSEQIVKLTLVEKLRQHPNAPSTIDPNPNNWSADDKARLDGTHATYPENWRTDDNAVREYLRLTYGDGANCSLKVGDTGYGGSPIPTPYGSCYPLFVFVQLVPECYEDNNDTMDTHDSRVLAETYEYAGLVLDTICEAFVAGSTSAQRVCENPNQAGLYDYTRASLWFDAFSNRSLSAFPTTVRPDNPVGFGPLPNTILYADTHNRMARAVNLLTRLRLDVPLKWEQRDYWYSGETAVNPYIVTGTCDSAVRQAWLDNATPPDANILTYDSGWYEVTSAPSIQGFSGAGLGCCNGTGDWCLGTSRVDTEWRVSIAPGWENAVADHVRALVQVGSLGVVAVREESIYYHRRYDEDPRTVCAGSPAANRWEMVVLKDSTDCIAVSPGRLQVPTAPAGDFGVFKPTAGSDPCDWGSVRQTVYHLLAFPGAFVEVPLVELS